MIDTSTQYWITLALTNFSLSMFILAVILILFHRLIVGKRVSGSEIIYRWMALFAAGLTGFFAFIMHVFYSELAAATIGWPTSPFQFEVGIADLGFGLLAFLSFNASYGFRLATVIGVTCWLWGDAAGHIYQMIKNHNYSTGNAGSWFWIDLILPLILLICISKLKSPKSA